MRSLICEFSLFFDSCCAFDWVGEMEEEDLWGGVGFGDWVWGFWLMLGSYVVYGQKPE